MFKTAVWSWEKEVDLARIFEWYSSRVPPSPFLLRCSSAFKAPPSALYWASGLYNSSSVCFVEKIHTTSSGHPCFGHYNFSTVEPLWFYGLYLKLLRFVLIVVNRVACINLSSSNWSSHCILSLADHLLCHCVGIRRFYGWENVVPKERAVWRRCKAVWIFPIQRTLELL